MPSPGVWKFAHTVPIVGPMIWAPPSDYNFPLDKFWLYNAASGGGLGSLVATSPKDLFCMTSDTLRRRRAQHALNNGYPERRLQPNPKAPWASRVGWGDKYEATDGGEGIDITSLPNGTYWLRGEVDPYHYFEESNYRQQHHRHQARNRRRHRQSARTDPPEFDAADRHPDEPGPESTLSGT